MSNMKHNVCMCYSGSTRVLRVQHLATSEFGFVSCECHTIYPYKTLRLNPVILPPRDIWQYLETFLAVTAGSLLLATSEQRPGMHVNSPTPQKNYLGLNDCSAKLKKHFSEITVGHIL